MEEERLNFRQRLEGQLLKFTNLVKGYQYRWVVIDPDNGVLEYYEKEDHKRISKPRGCVSLVYATVWPSDEDSQTFVVNASTGETLRLRAADAKERQLWVNRVRAVAEYQTEQATESVQPTFSPPAQLPSLLPVKERSSSALNGSASVGLGQHLRSVGHLSDQVPRTLVRPPSTPSYSKSGKSSESSSRRPEKRSETSSPFPAVEQSSACTSPVFLDPCIQLHELFRMLEQEGTNLSNDIDNLYASPALTFAHRNPEVTEVYRNLLILKATSQAAIKSLRKCLTSIQSSGLNVAATDNSSNSLLLPLGSHASTGSTRAQSVSCSNLSRSSNQGAPPPIINMTATPFLVDPDDEEPVPVFDYEQELGSVESQKTVILHILSQLKQGRDLTKVVLPTFILERRSLLEMFADYMAHPQLFIGITKGTSPLDRMVRFVKWYLTFFHAGKRDKIAKKPYNPIIGEVFHCSWRIPKGACEVSEPQTNPTDTAVDADHYTLSYCAEQVSHHPPVSAFRFVCPEADMELTASIHTQSRFQGISVCVSMLGKVILRLREHKEDYIFSLPSAYARAILTVPWIEIGDSVSVTCPQSGYTARINFHVKSKPTNKLHHVTAEIYAPDPRTASSPNTDGLCPIYRAVGEWNSSFRLEDLSSQAEETIDVKSIEVYPKYVRPLRLQAPEESQRLWEKVTEALRVGDINRASEEKFKLEDVQRVSENSRSRLRLPHHPKYFQASPNGWTYKVPASKPASVP
ncbi:Oxysterol-binding protein-related protein 11 [Sparganum proliferum]